MKKIIHNYMDIKSIIKKRGYTIEGVAKEMGITRVTLSQNLSTNKTPSLTTLKRIASVIGCSVGEFFMDEIEQHRDGVIVCPNCGKQITLHASCDEREMD